MKHTIVWIVFVISIIVQCSNSFDLDSHKKFIEEKLNDLETNAKEQGQYGIEDILKKYHMNVVLEKFPEALQDILFLVTIDPEEPEYWLLAGTTHMFLNKMLITIIPFTTIRMERKTVIFIQDSRVLK